MNIEVIGAGVKQKFGKEGSRKERRKSRRWRQERKKKKIAKDYSCCPDWPEVGM
jgi:hypothetical protein